MTSSKGLGLGQSPPHPLALSCHSGTSVCQLQWSWVWQPKRLRLYLWTWQPNSLRGHVGTGGPPSLVLHAMEANIPPVMAPMCVNMSHIQWIYHCQVAGCPEGPLSFCVANCTHMCHAHLGTKLMCPSYPVTFINSDALKWHGKQAQCTFCALIRI